MKKENLKENSNEEYLDEDTKRMKRKFKSLKSWADLIEGVTLVPIGLAIVLLICSIISCIGDKNSNIKYTIVDSMLSLVDEERREGDPITTDDIIKFTSIVSGDRMSRDDYMKEVEQISGLVKDTEKYILVLSVIKIIIALVDYAIVILIIDYLGKIFSDVAKEGTPFTANNIKYLNKINIFATILFFGVGRYNIGLVSLIIISAITYIFKHGYKLQQQVDETV